MSKYKNFLGLVLFIINFLLVLSMFASHMDITLVLYITVIILITLSVLTIKEWIRHDKLTNDNLYNNLFLIVNIMVLFIFIRSYFDPLLPIKSYEPFIMYSTDGSKYIPRIYDNVLFAGYNLVFIASLYFGLLVYNILNKNEKTH